MFIKQMKASKKYRQAVAKARVMKHMICLVSLYLHYFFVSCIKKFFRALKQKAKNFPRSKLRSLEVLQKCNIAVTKCTQKQRISE